MNYVLIALCLVFTAVAVAAIRHSRRPAGKPSAVENGKTDGVNARSDRELGFLADYREVLAAYDFTACRRRWPAALS